jgi:RimJ/RimL family protein N-acetyltransferase
MVTATISTKDVTLTSAPTLTQMKRWWAEFQNDPIRYHAYTDFMPTELDDFLQSVRQGDIEVWMFLVETDTATHIGGVYYLHDSGRDADGPYAWLGTYIIPAYRGRMAARAWRALRHQCAQQGLYRIFAAIRHSNHPAQLFIAQQMGFTRLGPFVDWSYFGGVLDTVVLYTMRPEDQGLAWGVAEQRAQRVRPLRPPVRRHTARKHLSPRVDIAYDRCRWLRHGEKIAPQEHPRDKVACP